MSDTPVDSSKRTWLIASGCAGAVGAGFVATPFVSSFQPSERAKAAGAAVEVDISALNPGEKLTVEWRGKPVWIMKRSPEQLESLKKIEGQLADPASDRNAYPSPGDKFATGPQPSLPDDWNGGFLCACHGSTFDLAGRVFKNKPAPDNLEVPPHMYLSDTKLIIGEDKKA